jgi:hypothetical protein
MISSTSGNPQFPSRQASAPSPGLTRPGTLKSILAVLFLLFSLAINSYSQAPADPKPLIDQALRAVGGPDKLLKIFRIKEIFHFGAEPQPAEGKKRSERESVLEVPGWWWIGKKERAEEPAKDDAWAWTLGMLVDPKSKIEVIPSITDEGRKAYGLRVSQTVTPAMDFYFDEETHLLLRIDWRTDIYRFSDWKEHDGLNYAAHTVIYKKAGNKPWFYHDILDLTRLSELPPGLVKTPAP